jgi:hypothetical protein
MIGEFSQHDLSVSITAAIKDGWEPFGGPVVHTRKGFEDCESPIVTMYNQAMVRYNDYKGRLKYVNFDD